VTSDPTGNSASAAAYALNYASSATGSSSALNHVWWIDVETANTWSSNQAANAAVVQGALTYLKQHTSKAVGVYSTGYQWGVITGGVHLGAPVWAAGASSAASAPSFCGTGFTGKPVKVVQYPAGSYDGGALSSSALGFLWIRRLPCAAHLKCLPTLVTYTLDRSIPAASNASSSTRPAGPTKGRPCLSSWSPGCSPTSTTSASAE